MPGRYQAECGVLLLLFSVSAIAATSYNGQTCSGNQPNGTSDHCPRGVESVSECQAAVNYSLQLVCSQCSAGIKWDHYSNGQWQAMTCTEQTLEFPADQVVLSLAGCYRCWCSLSPGGSTNSVVFSVDVKPPEAPKLLLNSTPEEHGEFFLNPLKVHLVANQQMIHILFTSTGYPNVTYDMYYKPLGKDNYLPITNHACLGHSGVHRDLLYYIPTVANQIEDFMCVVHNIAGNISVFQQVVYDSDPLWSIKPHPAQTAGSVIMDQEGGVGTAVCAAYKEDRDSYLDYFVCPIPDGMTVEEAACLYNRQNLRCYQCGDIGKGFNSTYGNAVSNLGINTVSCQLHIWVEGLFMCLAQRQGRLNGNLSIAQHIGNFSTGKVTPRPLSSHTELDLSLCYSVIAVIPFLFVILVILVCGCMCTWCCGLWTCRKGCSRSTRYKSKHSHTEEEGADGVTGLVNAPPFDEKTPLLRTVSKFMNVKKQRISQAISVRLLHAASGVEQRGRCEEKATNSACSWSLYHLELESGVKYKLEVLSAGETLSVITFSAPGTVEPKEPLPPEVNRLVALTGQKLMAFVPEMAADYEVIGILLGQENSVRNIRAGAEGAHQKMIRILEEWTGTEDASWSALIEALENYTPRLCGVAAGIRLFLRKELEKENATTVHQDPTPARLEAAEEL